MSLNLNTPFRPPRFNHKQGSQSRPVSSASTLSSSSRPSSSIRDRNSTPSPSSTGFSKQSNNGSIMRTYNVLWRKKTQKKHKQWDGDGVMSYNTQTRASTIRDEDGNLLAKLSNTSNYLSNVDLFSHGSYEFQIDSAIDAADDPVRQVPTTAPAHIRRPFKAPPPFVSPVTKKSPQHVNLLKNKKQTRTTPQITYDVDADLDDIEEGTPFTTTTTTSMKSDRSASPADHHKRSPLSSKYSSRKKQKVEEIEDDDIEIELPKPIKNKPFQTPLLKPRSELFRNSLKSKNKHEPLYDITSENAFVLPRPPNGKEDKIRDVVVDPVLANTLRPHQKEGIKFLYECVMGHRDFKGQGAILADEMGLGKTLQTITLIWTLCRQNPHIDEGPIAKKTLICCPVSLITTWKNEFKKWLGINKINVLTIGGKNKYSNDKDDIDGFAKTNVYQVLIMGYEKMQSMSKQLREVDFDLLVCDEGHRLKNSSNKVMQALESFNIKRRIVVTGTPIQNDLQEFYTIINFINPGILGEQKQFQKEFANPISRSREANCSNPRVIERGEQKSKELIKLTKLFILRRTNEEIAKFLPKKSDYIIFVPPTNLQLVLFDVVSKADNFEDIVESRNMNQSLKLINTFRKICNSPSILKNDTFFMEATGPKMNDANFKKGLAKKVRSGKVNLLVKLLTNIKQMTDEKVVIISNFTQTLDVLQTVLDSLNVQYSRLDGSTPTAERGGIIKSFNDSSADNCFAFLLSAKSGGCGLNLVGASRLILFDNDWNPSVDLQAMARIHRDGQKKPCKIYRLITAGCIDEKIFQRQLVKTNLSDKFLDDSSHSDEDFFNSADLRDLFKVNGDVKCNTHDLMNCQCAGTGKQPVQLFDDDESDEDGPSERLQKLSEMPSFVSAFDYSQNPTDLDEQFKKQQKQIGRCLAGYRHIDPFQLADEDSRYNTSVDEETRDDEVLNEVLTEQKLMSSPGNKKAQLISYIFAKY
ncbi:unnamed protein product [Ambrosiozyma monospora]|uniref:Unnamed protein product n=1 Tax=Ambrosiozyma monospora TaxID=43982 RepID=A0ACB5SWH9_AMBMO|nr:unnamed protein product [Ambrosiozyma monospora]